MSAPTAAYVPTYRVEVRAPSDPPGRWYPSCHGNVGPWLKAAAYFTGADGGGHVGAYSDLLYRLVEDK